MSENINTNKIYTIVNNYNNNNIKNQWSNIQFNLIKYPIFHK